MKMLKIIIIQTYLREYGDVFYSDGAIVICEVSEVKVNTGKNYSHVAFENK